LILSDFADRHTHDDTTAGTEGDDLVAVEKCAPRHCRLLGSELGEEKRGVAAGRWTALSEHASKRLDVKSDILRKGFEGSGFRRPHRRNTKRAECNVVLRLGEYGERIDLSHCNGLHLPWNHESPAVYARWPERLGATCSCHSLR
jgi:hypothetical protein